MKKKTWKWEEEDIEKVKEIKYCSVTTLINVEDGHVSYGPRNLHLEGRIYVFCDSFNNDIMFRETSNYIYMLRMAQNRAKTSRNYYILFIYIFIIEYILRKLIPALTPDASRIYVYIIL